MKKNVVVIAGGNGSAKSLRGLKEHGEDLNLSAVISMSDSGGSSGRLREEFGILPPGDIMRAILSLSPYDYRVLREIFYRPRFKETGKLDNHNLGNLFITLAQQYDGDIIHAFSALHQAVQAQGTAHPATVETSDLSVELKDGTVIIGEHDIDEPTWSRENRIVKAWLDPLPTIYSGAADAITNADTIILGPGSMYTSIIATLCVGGIQEKIAASKATLIFILGDAFQRKGETGPTKASEFIAEMEQYLPRPLDVIVMSDIDVLTEKQKQEYDERNWDLIDDDVKNDLRVERTNLQRPTSFGISGPKLGDMLHEIIMRT